MISRDLRFERDRRMERLIFAFRKIPRPTDVKGDPWFSQDEVDTLLSSDPHRLDLKVLNAFVQELYSDNFGLFYYLLPGIFEAWSEFILSREIPPERRQALALFVQNFYSALQIHQIIEKNLVPRLQQAVRDFLREVILDAMQFDDRCDWREPVEVYPTISDDFGILWTRWWEMPTQDLAYAAVEYAALFICDMDEEPLGYGTMRTSKSSSSLEWEAWLPANVAFMDVR